MMRKCIFVLLLLAVVVVGAPTPTTAAPSLKGKTIARNWKEGLLSRQGRSVRSFQGGSQQLVYTSATHDARQEFTAVGPHWKASVPPGARLDVLVRTSSDGQAWGPWRTVALTDPDIGRDRGRSFGALISDGVRRYAQYQVRTSPSRQGEWPRLDDVTLTFLDSRSGPSTEMAAAAAATNTSTLGAAKPAVISRAGWGADESLRFDAKGQEIWPREYLQITKAVYHDTITMNNDPNPAQTVRNVYYYHAVTRGWGDIGYNYLIDEQGRIYEGRAGGENVVAGHALCYNWGSIGIAALGDHAKVAPSAAMVTAFEQITAWALGRAGIDPLGRGTFMKASLTPTADLPNIMAHKDTTYSSFPCQNTHVDPGPYLYNKFGEIRQSVASLMGYTPRPKPVITDVTFAPTDVAVGGEVRVEVRVRNDGTGQMDTQGPAPGTRYAVTDTWGTRGFDKVPGKYRVFVDRSNDTSGVDGPFRWGLGSPLLPGEARTIVGYITFPTQNSATWWAGLNQELVETVLARTGDTKVTASGSTAPAAPVAYARLSRMSISPNGDGQAESFSLTYQLSAARSVKLEVYTAAGQWVRTLRWWAPIGTTAQSVGVPGTYYDQVRRATLALPDGSYSLKMQLRDANRVVREVSLPFWSDTVKPVSAVPTRSPAFISPNGDGLQDATRISTSFSEPTQWRISITNASGALIRAFTGSGASAGGVWDGKDSTGKAVADGQYTYAITYCDAAANCGYPRQGPVYVDRVRPAVTSVALSGSSPYTLRYNLSETSVVSSTITDSAGRTVAALPLAVKASGAASSAWDGKNSAAVVVPAGTYTWNLYVRDRAGNRNVAYPIRVSVAVTGTGQEVVVDNSSASFSASANWSTGSYNSPYAGNYRYRRADGSAADPATYSASLSGGSYNVYVWYTSGTNRTPGAVYNVRAGSVWKPVKIDQRTGGGQWRILGTFTLSSGTNLVRLSAPAGSAGVVIADAVKWVKR